MRISGSTPGAPVQTVADSAATDSARPAAAPAAQRELESVVLQPALAALKEMGEIDHERVAQLRDALAKGELPFNASKLAGLIQKYHGELTVAELSRQDAMRMLLDGIAADLQAYQQMLELIAQQFEAAIRHQSERLGQLAQEIGALVDVLEARRVQRVELATRLAGPAPSMQQVFTLLKPEPRARLQADWTQLEAMVQTAREMGRRNAELLAEQYTIMQRVLHGDDQTYEPV